MEHKTEKFQFINRDGKPEILFSRRYTFKLEKVLIERFGKEVLQDYSKTHSLTADITIENIKEDFPKLLTGDVDSIDFEDQDWDELMRVYLFFIQYKQNALLRHYLQEKEILVSAFETLKTILPSMQEASSKKES